MESQSVKIELPRQVYRRLEKLAAATNQSFDSVLLQTIRGNMPPLLEDAPLTLRAEFGSLLRLKDDALWAVARAPQNQTQWRRHQRLLKKNAEHALTPREQSELEQLRVESDQAVLRKSFALAILKWRGHSLPTITNVKA